MAPRAIWKGFLKIRLLNIPIKVYPATESSATLSLNQLHSTCTTRMQQKRWCPICAREVASEEIVKGFEFEPGHYVCLLPEELEAVRPPSTRVIDLTAFAPAEQLEPRAVDRAYFLAVDGHSGGAADEAYRTIQAAMNGRLGIGKVALYGREYLVAVAPMRGTLMLYTLHHAAELRDPPAVVTSDRFLPGVADARQLFTTMTAPLNLTQFTDEYAADLRRLIDSKIAGAEILIPLVPDAPPIVNLREALTQSLSAASASRKRPAKVTPSPRRKRA